MAMIHGGGGIKDDKVAINVFYNWYYKPEDRMIILMEICQLYENHKESLLPYLNNIKYVLAKGKQHYLDVGLDPYLVGEISQMKDTNISFEAIYDRFDYPIIWINHKIQEIEAWIGFEDRIKGKLSQHEIITYFKRLCDFPLKNGTRVVILQEEIVLNLVYANFAGFSTKMNKQKLETPNIKQNELRAFIYAFYEKHSLEAKTEPYIHFMKDNFSIFDNTSFETLKKSFSKK